MNCWEDLGIEWTQDQTAIRRAYARKLKLIDPETDPQAFIALREARDWAMALAEMDVEPVFEHAEEVAPVEPAWQAPSPVMDPRPSAPALEVDDTAIEQLRALVLTGPPPPRSAIVDAAHAVLADDAMINLAHAERVEHLFAALIIEGRPRGDALIDLAIEQFKWRERCSDLDRPDQLSWILQRQEDRVWEVELAHSGGAQSLLLSELRQPPPRWGKVIAWTKSVRMEHLFAVLEQYHPTVLAGVDQTTLTWWWDRIEEQRAAPLPLRWLRERWRRWTVSPVTGRAIGGRLLLYVAIFLFPYLFVWTLLRRGFTAAERVVGFGYLAVVIVAFLLAGTGTKTAAPPVTVLSPTVPAASDREGDIDILIQRSTDSTVIGSALRDRNPKLYAKLSAIWDETRGAAEPFWVHASKLVDDQLGRSLRGDDAQLILDHAAYYASRLRWAERISPDQCVAVLKGTGPDESAESRAYRGRLVGRAILAGQGRTHPVAKRTAIPPALFKDAVARSRLTPTQFNAGLSGKGTAHVRCNTQIALLDAARERPAAEALPVLRGMFK